jgi:hypothetical protein
MKRSAWLVLVVAALGCKSEPPPDPELNAACDDLCFARDMCGDPNFATVEECTQACVADVGTPGPSCEDAIRVVGECTADHCGDEAACNDALAGRDQACGGTG